MPPVVELVQGLEQIIQTELPELRLAAFAELMKDCIVRTASSDEEQKRLNALFNALSPE